MPRQPRYQLINVPQHVVQRGNNRQATFFADEDCIRYLEDLKTACETHCCELHAYVLMTNHVHLLLTPRKPDGVAKVMQSLGRRYVVYVNQTYLRTGTLWEGRYKAALVDAEDYLLRCMRYIELNPVRAEMVKTPEDWRWSSYRYNAASENSDLLTPHEVYLALGPTDLARQGIYRELFSGAFDKRTLAEIRDSVNQCLAFGGERFKDEVEIMLARRIRPGKPGRPKKEDVGGGPQGIIPV